MIMCSGLRSRYSEKFPSYMRDWPRVMVKQRMKRLDEDQLMIDDVVRLRVEEGRYDVHSQGKLIPGLSDRAIM